MKLHSLKMLASLAVLVLASNVSVLANETDWKDAYIAYAKQEDAELSHESIIGLSKPSFKLVYIDADDIPELCVFGESTADGDQICTFHNGKLTTMYLYRGGLSYMEKQNLLCDSGGHMDEYYDNVYKIENGEFVQLYKGNYGAEDIGNVQWDEETDEPIYEYYWNDEQVSKDKYSQMLSSVLDKDTAIKAYEGVEADEIIEQISAVNTTSQSSAGNQISVILNGSELSFAIAPYIENGTTMVPMRAIFEALGADVDYEARTKTITAVRGDTTVKLVTGATTAMIDDNEVTLGTAVANKNGNTMVPLRFVSEALGAEVGWEASTRTITISLD